MKTRAIVVALLSVASLVPVPSGAATFIGVADNYFDPSTYVAGAGDTVEWRTVCSYGGSCSGAHNITAYRGASFTSGGNLGYPGTFSVTLTTDDPVFYRCTIHSSLIDDRCNGMCGVISNDLDVVRPTASVSSPGQDELIIAPGLAPTVRIAGTASDNVAVAAVEIRIYNAVGSPTTHAAQCPSCPSATASWERSLALTPGVYTVEARAFDTSGNSATSARVRFFVL